MRTRSDEVEEGVGVNVGVCVGDDVEVVVGVGVTEGVAVGEDVRVEEGD